MWRPHTHSSRRQETPNVGSDTPRRLGCTQRPCYITGGWGNPRGLVESIHRGQDALRPHDRLHRRLGHAQRPAFEILSKARTLRNDNSATTQEQTPTGQIRAQTEERHTTQDRETEARNRRERQQHH